MDCNKEEALRAKSIAEKKMQLKDFVGAQKIALKAQQLFPDLENISHMLTVCEVHCSAAIKVNGSEDWYGILQVEPMADESSIKKQYRKLALQLHPDKNKFAGAEAAFKLIGEAHRTLSDKAKRSVYDMKRASIRTAASKPPPPPPNRSSFVRVQPGFSNNFKNHNTMHTGMNHQQQQQEAQASGSQTFWTLCPFCGIKYQYYRTIMNKTLRCQNCLRPFTAYDLNIQAAPTGMNHNTSQQSSFGNATSKMGFQGNIPTSSVPGAAARGRTEPGGRSSKTKEGSKVGIDPAKENKMKFEKVNFEEMKRSEHTAEFPRNPKGKRKKNVVESSDSDSSDEVVIEEGDCPAEKDVAATANYHPRRSSRRKQNIRYNENQSDEEDDRNSDDNIASPLKRLRKGGSSHHSDQTDKVFSEGKATEVKMSATEENLPNGNKQAGDHKEEDSESGASSDTDSGSSEPNPDLLSYPDPEFHDFQKERDTSAFGVNEVWALYDDLDGMPRFYALIRKSWPSPSFKVRFQWLEFVPKTQAERDWSGKELPISGGLFKLGSTETSEDRPMFSHVMAWKKDPSTRGHNYVIHPLKGDIWALFKDWQIKWISDPENHKSYGYEIVEVLSDYTEDTDIVVAPLIKVKGFVSLFARKTNEETWIPPDEMLRFSHMVPSHKMTGEEGEGVPEGSYELDTASLPANFQKVFPSATFVHISAEVKDAGKEAIDPHTESAALVKKSGESLNKNAELTDPDARENCHSKNGDVLAKKVNGDCKQGKSPCSAADAETESHDGSPPSSPEPFAFEYPDTEFHRFESEKSYDKLERGQIWALYSDIDGFPKYYAMIKKVDVEAFKVQISWLEAYPVLEDEILWLRGGLPFGCGRFKLSSGSKHTETYDSLDTLSHLVQAEASDKKNQFDIYPHAGEVWAVYRNWSARWEESDRDGCDYDLMEILPSTNSTIKVQFLVKVKGFNAVFMPKRSGVVPVTMEFPRNEFLRFSHRVPSFRLTEERGGKLRGYWELDPASVPEALLCTSDS